VAVLVRDTRHGSQQDRRLPVVISTVRVRYAYNSGFGVTDVISTINAPGQFTA